jgi:DNA modification methylase
MKLGPFEVPGYHLGDCRALLAELPDDSVHCVVSSPPYWALRDYGIEPTVWGGDPVCSHAWGEPLSLHKGGPHGGGSSLLEGGRTVVDAQAALKDVACGSFCACGAWRGQLGLEPRPDLFVDHLVEVLHQVWRVLRPDGTLWLNLGDSYAAGGNGGGGSFMGLREHNGWGHRADKKGWRGAPVGLKPKDLVGIPWRVAFALQAEGWWLRSDIVWAKPNPMPEAVTDRPTKAHEYLFLLSKSERYHYDADAIKEPVSPEFHSQQRGATSKVGKNEQTADRRKSGFNERWRVKQTTSGRVERRNKRSVWTVATEPTPDAHFATFPRKLVEPCILAGCPPGGVVLDPFGGSGTVGRVAEDHGRHWLLFDLNPAYGLIAKRKTAQMGLLARAAAGAEP